MRYHQHEPNGRVKSRLQHRYPIQTQQRHNCVINDARTTAYATGTTNGLQYNLSDFLIINLQHLNAHQRFNNPQTTRI